MVPSFSCMIVTTLMLNNGDGILPIVGFVRIMVETKTFVLTLGTGMQVVQMAAVLESL